MIRQFRARRLPLALLCCLGGALAGGCGSKKTDAPQYDKQHFFGSPAALSDAQLSKIPEPYRDMARQQRDAALKGQPATSQPPPDQPLASKK